MGPGSNATITEEMYRASLLSAVEDKIRRRLREVFDQAQVTVCLCLSVRPSECCGVIFACVFTLMRTRTFAVIIHRRSCCNWTFV